MCIVFLLLKSVLFVILKKGDNLKNNVVILCLSYNYAKYLGSKLANSLDMFFADINDILEYNLVNQNMIDTAGIEYFEKEKLKTITSVAQYENALICGSFDILTNSIDLLKQNSVVVYLYFNELELNKIETSFEYSATSKIHIAFKDEDKIFKNFADITAILTSDENQNIKIIKDTLINYFQEKYWWI